MPLLIDRFSEKVTTPGWHAYDVDAAVRNIGDVETLTVDGTGQAFWGNPAADDMRYRDVTVTAEITPSKAGINAGLIVRATKQTAGHDAGGYWVNLRILDAGYTIVQLYRLSDTKLLQEARVHGNPRPGEPCE